MLAPDSRPAISSCSRGGPSGSRAAFVTTLPVLRSIGLEVSDVGLVLLRTNLLSIARGVCAIARVHGISVPLGVHTLSLYVSVVVGPVRRPQQSTAARDSDRVPFRILL